MRGELIRACLGHLRAPQTGSRPPGHDLIHSPPKHIHHPSFTCPHPHSPTPSRLTPRVFVCQLRDWLHVIANSKTSYELRYYNIHDQDADEDED